MVFLHSDFFLKIRRKSAKFRGHADCQILALLKRVIFSLCLVVPIFARARPARPGMDNSPINRSRCKRGPAERNCDKTGLCRKIIGTVLAFPAVPRSAGTGLLSEVPPGLLQSEPQRRDRK